jgi:hypothetical protein
VKEDISVLWETNITTFPDNNHYLIHISHVKLLYTKQNTAICFPHSRITNVLQWATEYWRYCRKYKPLSGPEAVSEYFMVTRNGEANSYTFGNASIYVTFLSSFRRFFCNARSDPDKYRIDILLTNSMMQAPP